MKKEKGDCAWGCARRMNNTWENHADRNTNQSGERNERLPDLCFSIWRFSQVVFILPAEPHAQSLFYLRWFLALIWFIFRWEEVRCSRKFDRLFRCFGPLSRSHLTEAKRRVRILISYCWYNPQPMRKDHSIAGTTILQTTLNKKMLKIHNVIDCMTIWWQR